MAEYARILVDDPAEGVRRITLNRPEKRNALDNRLRGEVFHVLEEAGRDPGLTRTLASGGLNKSPA